MMGGRDRVEKVEADGLLGPFISEVGIKVEMSKYVVMSRFPF